MPQGSGQSVPKPKSIPSANRWKYSMTFNPDYKSAKLVKMDLETLCCRLTHCVQLQYEDFSENDEMHVIYSRHAGQKASFMRKWLHFFVTEAYNKYFISSGYQYLNGKGMDLDMWSESIIDGRKAYFLPTHGSQ